MANSRQILERRGAAENISKVTHTMETISAVRYRSYYQQWSNGTDFYDNLAQLAYLIVTAGATVEHPLMLSNDSQTNALVVIGSDRGLCGAYNHNIIRMLDVHINMAKRFHRELKIYVKGGKIAHNLRNRGIKVEKVYDQFGEVPSVEQVKEMGDDFSSQFAAGRIGRLAFVYTRFFSVASQKAQTLTILPVSDLIDDLTTRTTVIWPWELALEDFILSPSAGELFESVAELMIRTCISGCFADSAVSQHLARVVAMRSATDNADDMIESLTRDYNRARQGQITTELLDIIGGAVTRTR